jgi:uncharacterized protein (DUF952 family)
MDSQGFSKYLARGALNHEHPQKIYHMCLEDLYSQQMSERNHSYLPPTFVEDGNMIHATENPSQLLAVGTHFYKGSQGKWICLELDPVYLGSPVIYEGASAVGDIPPMPWVTPGEKFPHIYGNIPQIAVTRVFRIIRSESGEFNEIKDLCKI